MRLLAAEPTLYTFFLTNKVHPLHGTAHCIWQSSQWGAVGDIGTPSGGVFQKKNCLAPHCVLTHTHAHTRARKRLVELMI